MIASHEDRTRHKRALASFIARGLCRDLVDHCFRRHQLVTSEFILGELQKTLAGKFGASDLQAQEAAGLLRSRMEVVVRAVLPTPVARDASGDAVLGTAVAGAATCLITGDKDLLVLKRFGEIDILTNKPQAASRKLPPAPKKRGPKPDVLKIEGDWREAIKKSLKKKKPPEGWPK